MIPHDSSPRQSTLAVMLPAAVVFAVTLVLVPSVVDVDLWGHVRFGGDIVSARTIPSADSYSFTADRAWVNHEWLAEVLMYEAYAAAGGGGLTALRLALIGATLWIVMRCLVWSGVTGRRKVTLLALVAVLTYTRTQHVRPQLFSVFLFAVLLATLISARRSSRPLWLVPAVIALWVNLHGGWIVGLAIFSIWTALELLWPEDASRDRVTLVIVLLAALAATLVNPYGTGLWSFLWETVGLGRPDISEWHPIPRTPPGVIAFWSVTALAALVAIRRAWQTRANLRDAAIVLVLAVLSFRVSRLDAFFTLAVFTLTAGAFASAPRIQPTRVSVQRLNRRAIAAATLCALALRWPAIKQIDLGAASWLPEPEAVAFIRSHAFRGNMLTYFDWGEYAIWHLAPAVKVSMDGRRETVYGPTPIERHLAVYRSEMGGVSYVQQLKPDYVWLPKTLKVVSALQSTGDWTVVYQGSQSAVLARRAIGAGTAPDSAPVTRHFPGP